MPKMQIYADRAGQYRWRLKADNHEIVAVSESYVSKQGALNRAKLVQQLAPRAFLEDMTIQNNRWF